jgi:hypothetical protein
LVRKVITGVRVLLDHLGEQTRAEKRAGAASPGTSPHQGGRI